MKELLAVVVLTLLLCGCVEERIAKLTTTLEEDKEICAEKFRPQIPDNISLEYDPVKEVWMLREIEWKDGKVSPANNDFRPGMGPDEDPDVYYTTRLHGGSHEAGYVMNNETEDRTISFEFKLVALPKTLTGDGLEMQFRIIDVNFTWCDWYM